MSDKQITGEVTPLAGVMKVETSPGNFALAVDDGTRPTDFEVVAPSDSVDLAKIAIGFSFAGDGDITVITKAGNTKLIPAGSLAPQAQHSLRFTRVKATG